MITMYLVTTRTKAAPFAIFLHLKDAEDWIQAQPWGEYIILTGKFMLPPLDSLIVVK